MICTHFLRREYQAVLWLSRLSGAWLSGSRLSGAEGRCASGWECSSRFAVLAAAESRTGQARLPVCRVSGAKQTPSWRGAVGTPEEALTTTRQGSLESIRRARRGDLRVHAVFTESAAPARYIPPTVAVGAFSTLCSSIQNVRIEFKM